MRFFLPFLVATLAFGADFFAKIEPWESYSIKASTQGQVVNAPSKFEGTLLGDVSYVDIDDKVEKLELKNAKQTLSLLQKELKATKEILQASQSVVSIAKSQYEKIKSLATKSKVEKDARKQAYLSAKISALNIENQLASLQTQISTTRLKIDSLRDAISKKHFSNKNLYLYNLAVRQGDFVNYGSLVATLADISKARLTLYLLPEEVASIEGKIPYIEGEKARLHKVFKIADSAHLSSYRVEIEMRNPTSFSKVVKVDFR